MEVWPKPRRSRLSGDDEYELNPSWFNGVETVGVTAGASAPEHLVQRLIEHVQSLYGFEAHRGVE